VGKTIVWASSEGEHVPLKKALRKASPLSSLCSALSFRLEQSDYRNTANVLFAVEGEGEGKREGRGRKRGRERGERRERTVSLFRFQFCAKEREREREREREGV
jgi:hypothetical protein